MSDFGYTNSTCKQDEFVVGLALHIRFVDKSPALSFKFAPYNPVMHFIDRLQQQKMHFAVYLQSRVPNLEYLAIQQKHNQSLVCCICQDSYLKQFKTSFLERSINSALLNIPHVRKIVFCPMVLHHSYCSLIQKLQLELEFTEIN